MWHIEESLSDDEVMISTRVVREPGSLRVEMNWVSPVGDIVMVMTEFWPVAEPLD